MVATASADATADSTIYWAEGQTPSSVNDSARGVMAAHGVIETKSAARSSAKLRPDFFAA
jgi:hypothetical protein